MDELSDAQPEASMPEGYESVEQFLTEARERFQEGVDADRENRDAALDDLRFLTGEGQWDATVKAARLAKGRPCLTINTLPQFVGQVIGDIRTNRPGIKVRPAEDGDKKIAEVRQGLIRFIENQSGALQVYALAGEDQVSCGIGHFRVELAYADDASFDQDIRIRHIPNPLAVVWDPLSVDPTGADARFSFVVDEMDRKTFDAAYPDTKASDLTVPQDQGGWVSRETVRVTEYWVMKETKRTIALVQRVPDAQATVEDITDDKDARAFIVGGKTREVVKRTACMYLINGYDILEGPFEYDITRIPVFRVIGREIRVGERRFRFSLIRFAKDPIRMKNLWRSSAAEWLAQAPKQQWLLHAADEQEANRYRNAGKSGDTVLTYSGQIAPQRIDPPTAASALLQEAQFNDQDIKDVTGLHDASLGMKSNETSGKAILARERQGDVATFMYHDNLNAAVKECGKVVNQLLPAVFDTARTITVLGEDETSKGQRINDPTNPESIDLGSGKYDIVVETGPSYSTKRVEAAEQLMQLVQSVPAIGQVGGDIIVSSLDIPHGDALADRLKKMLPPNIAPQDDAELTPEMQQQRQMQAQQQQMQMQAQQQAMQLDMAEKAAKVDLTRAQAMKLVSEAQGAGQPQGQQPDELDFALKVEQVRKAKADADKAEAEAEKARLEVPKTQIAVMSDAMDLERKPLERAHSEADLNTKLQPPEPEPAE